MTRPATKRRPALRTKVKPTKAGTKQKRGAAVRATPTSDRRKKKQAMEKEKPAASNRPIPIREVLQAPSESCANCGTDLRSAEKALFVEEEVGRVFCSESCISSYFGSDIERMEREFQKLRSPDDLSSTERKKLEHLRWNTLQEPDETWRERTLSGDQRYTLIAEFSPRENPIWCICLCLFLRGEPSFLYLAILTRDPEMVDHYRRGERLEWKSSQGLQSEKPENLRGSKDALTGGRKSERSHADGVETEGDAQDNQSASLAAPFTEEETYRAQISQTRREDDIPQGDFGQFQHFLEGTLENPDEVWSLEAGKGEQIHRIYHFIKKVQQAEQSLWYVIIAKDTPEDEEQLEILDAFPTKDPELVDQFRRGDHEVGEPQQPSLMSRSVH
jgi:hypothetical protein